MWPTFYSKRLAGDLEKWLANGWVTAENANAIRASLDRNEETSRLPVIITILGAVLIGFSAMAFVAANWTDMSKALRLSLLAIAMWSAYGTAAALHFRKQSGFAEAALLVGVGLFGANIMLVGQMYHLPSDFSAGLLVWSLGALVTAWAVRSKSALIAAQLLLMGWVSNELFGGTLQFAYLAPWAAAALLAIRLNWTPTNHLALIGLLFWLFGNAPSFAENIGWGPFELLSTLTALFALLFALGIVAEQKGRPFARALQAYGALALLVFFWVGQIIDEQLETGGAQIIPVLSTVTVLVAGFFAFQRVRDIAPTDVLALTAFPAGVLATGAIVSTNSVALWFSAPLLLILCIWLVAFATRLHNRFLINLGFAGFGGEALYLYLRTFGTLLDTAAFFAIGGVLLIAGGFVWERLRRRATATQSEVSS